MNAIARFVKGRFSVILFSPILPYPTHAERVAVSIGLNEVSFDRLLIVPAKGSLSCEQGESRSVEFGS